LLTLHTHTSSSPINVLTPFTTIFATFFFCKTLARYL
jgi:hypothetical protein